MPGFTRSAKGVFKHDSSPSWTVPEAASNVLWLPLTADPNDISGNGYDFTEVGSPTYSLAPGGSINCLRLDGTDDYLTLADPQGLTGTTSFSFSAWAYAEGWGGSDFGRIISKGITPRVVDCWVNGNTGNHDVTIWAENSQNNTPSQIVTPDFTFSLNTWHNISCSWRSGYQAIYIDNVLEISRTTTYTTLVSSATPMLVGNRGDLVRNWQGYISNVMYWKDVELSQSELLTVMNNTSPI